LTPAYRAARARSSGAEPAGIALRGCWPRRQRRRSGRKAPARSASEWR
jgi:hypothetical protein